mgnify:FL=1
MICLQLLEDAPRRYWLTPGVAEYYRWQYVPAPAGEPLPPSDKTCLRLVLTPEQFREIWGAVCQINGKGPALNVEAAIARVCEEWADWYDQLHGHGLPAGGAVEAP